MKITKNKLNNTIKKIIERNKQELYKYRVENVTFQYVNIKKVRGKDEYDIIVSVDEIEIPLVLIRDIIEETYQELDIKIRKIMIEI